LSIDKPWIQCIVHAIVGWIGKLFKCEYLSYWKFDQFSLFILLILDRIPIMLSGDIYIVYVCLPIFRFENSIQISNVKCDSIVVLKKTFNTIK
jgi:hypothetical protein